MAHESTEEPLAGGQIIFSPSRNPYETLPGFIKGWAVTDLVFAGIWALWALVHLVVVIVFLLSGRPHPWDVLYLLIPAALAALLGFFANIQLLSRKPSAMPAARVLIAFKIIHLLWYLLLNGVAVLIAQDPMVRVVIGGITLLMLAARITLLVFYWIAVARAGHYFAGRKRLLGF